MSNINTNVIISQSPAATNKLVADATADQTLQLGQVLFGKVMRVYDDGSYLVDLNGRQHVIDSTIPLQQNEVFRGKVIGLAERALLEKMVDTEAAEVSPPLTNTADALINQFDKNINADLKTFIQQHFKTFDAATWKTLVSTARRTEHPALALATAVYLQKLGLPPQRELITKLTEQLSAKQSLSPLLSKNALHLQTTPLASMATAQNTAAQQALTNYLKEKSEESIDHARDLLQQSRNQHLLLSDGSSATVASATNQENDDPTEQQLNQAFFQWLLNTQNGGAVAHRLVVLPLVLNGSLIELEMALFDQETGTKDDPDLKQKVVHLSLQTEQLGKIDATINAINQNLRIHFSSDSEHGLAQLAAHHQELAQQLQALECKVDEQSYRLRSDKDSTNVTQPIMNLVINSDTLSLLV